MEELQVDFIRLNKSKIEKTGGGGLRIPVVYCGAGELRYFQADGSTEVQTVPFDVISAPEYINSIIGGAVTLLHPQEDVSPENFQKYGVGVSLAAQADRNTGLLKGVISVNQADAIKSVLDGVTTDISMGYFVAKKYTSRNQATQLRRRHNHVSLVSEGRDSQARLNLDNNIWIMDKTQLDSATKSPAKPKKNSKKPKPVRKLIIY